jgi:hypothetical protein
MAEPAPPDPLELGRRLLVEDYRGIVALLAPPRERDTRGADDEAQHRLRLLMLDAWYRQVRRRDPVDG